MSEEKSKHIGAFLSVYDVLGYLAPGATALTAGLLFEIWAREVVRLSGTKTSILHVPILTSLSKLHQIIPNDDWLLSSMFGLGILVAIYIAGHVIASVSALGIDRLLVFKGYGYPYEFLLQTTRPADKEWARVSGAFYKGYFFWFVTYLLVHVLALYYGVEHSSATPYVAFVAHTLGWGLVVVVLIKVFVGMARAKRSPRLIHWFSGRLLKNGVLFGHKLLKIFGLPYDIIAGIIGGIIDTRRSFDDPFLAHYKNEFIRKFLLDPDVAKTNNFWLSYMYVSDKSPRLSGIADNWRTLYSFARNLSTALFIGFLYQVAWLFSYGPELRLWRHDAVAVLFLIPAVTITLSLIMLVRYYLLYVSYFSKFVFRAFVYLTSLEQTSPAVTGRSV